MFLDLETLFSLATLYVISDSHCYNRRLRFYSLCLEIGAFGVLAGVCKILQESGALQAQIYFLHTTHEPLWAQKFWFRYCDRQYKHNPHNPSREI